MARSLEPKPIKSAQRVFQVLEFFESGAADATVSQIALHYGYPQSSTSELLNYMVHLGYLRRGKHHRTFSLSLRAAMIGSWTQPDLVRSGKLFRLMDGIAANLSGDVLLTTRRGVNIQCLQVLRDGQGSNPAEVLPHLLRSAEGRAHLLSVERELVKRFVHRLNHEAEEGADRVVVEELFDDLDASRARGYVKFPDGDRNGYAVTIESKDGDEPLVLSVHTHDENPEVHVIQTIRRQIADTIGLVSVAAARSDEIGNARVSGSVVSTWASPDR